MSFSFDPFPVSSTPPVAQNLPQVGTGGPFIPVNPSGVTSEVNDASPYWLHNGSKIKLVAEGQSRKFFYLEPRSGMIAAGAQPGSLLFEGTTTNMAYTGTAYIFDRRCGRLPYSVEGPILDGYRRVELAGMAPRVDSNCNVVSYFEDKLEFELVEPTTAAVKTDIVQPIRSTPDIDAQSTGHNNNSTAVPMRQEGGTYVVAVIINNSIALDFVVDSGAADVTIPGDVFLTLVRTGTINQTDFIGKRDYKLADGSTMASATFRIRSLKVGDQFIENVTGSIAPVAGSLLLGQSFLNRFNSWSVNNARHELVLQ